MIDFKTISLHKPVMLQEAIGYLVVPDANVYVDCTVGAGGHAYSILECATEYSSLIGLDIDPQAIDIARQNLDIYDERVTLVKGNFADLKQILSQLGVSEVDGIIMDLGVSSIQLDTTERGFSFRSNAPLDMRMDQTVGNPVSYDLNKLGANDLESIIREFGEERFARRIANNIIAAREISPILMTKQLADIVWRSKPKSKESINPATRTFQAFRIYKNQELANLTAGIQQAVSALKRGGRICVISFHSLEDRIVKNGFRTMARGCVCPPEMPKCICNHKPILKIITKQPIKPTEAEITANPRSRSAKLRVAEKI